MALKRKITKAEHTALPPLIQAEYKAEGEDFVLSVEGFEDPVELKRAKDREVQNAKEAKERADKAEQELRTLKESSARNSGDVTALEKSWKEREALKEKEHKAELDKRDKHLQATLVDSVATALASELGGENASLLLPHIKGRLTADLSGETPLTRVLDKDGKPSASSVEDLKKEIAANPAFKAVIIASKGTGGGAAGTGRPVNGGAVNGEKKFKDLTEPERIAMYKTDPAAFAKAAEESRKEALTVPPIRHVA